jgi:hypothetical protein
MRILLLAGLLICSLAPFISAQGPGRKEDQAFLFEMRGKTWGAVFEWLTDKTGRPFISRDIPPGTFNFITQKDQKFTIPQVIDIINDGLYPLKYVLIDKGTSFTVYPADLDFEAPRVAPEDLSKHGQTEIVATVLKLKSLVAEDLAPEVKKQLGPFGKVVPLPSLNQMILQDRVVTLQRIIATIREADQAETFSHKCVFIRAREAESVLRSLLGEQQQIIEMLPAGAQAQAGQAAARQAPKQKIRVYTLSSDENTNTVFVSGPPDKIALAKGVLATIDVGARPIPVGTAVLHTYPVSAGNAEILAKNLAEIYKGTAHIRIVPLGNNQIMINALPEDHFMIARHFQELKQPPTAMELISLAVLDAARVAESLKAVFPDYKNLAPYIEADPTRNAILVKGTAEQVADVKSAIRSIGEDNGGTMRIINLERGGAAPLAEALQKLLQQARPDSPVRINVPGGKKN